MAPPSVDGGEAKFWRSTSVPKKRSSSTWPGMPVTVPVQLYCQNAAVVHGAGTDVAQLASVAMKSG